MQQPQHQPHVSHAEGSVTLRNWPRGNRPRETSEGDHFPRSAGPERPGLPARRVRVGHRDYAGDGRDSPLAHVDATTLAVIMTSPQPSSSSSSCSICSKRFRGSREPAAEVDGLAHSHRLWHPLQRPLNSHAVRLTPSVGPSPPGPSYSATTTKLKDCEVAGGHGPESGRVSRGESCRRLPERATQGDEVVGDLEHRRRLRLRGSRL